MKKPYYLLRTQDYSFDLPEQLNSQNEYIVTQESVVKEVEEMLDILVDIVDENTIKGKSKPELDLVEYIKERREFKNGNIGRGLYDFLTRTIK